MVTVVKIGGSLFPKYVDELCDVLVQSDEELVLINGGGELANKIREYDEKYMFSDDVNHWNAIMCMDIIGNCIADKHEDIVAVNSFESIKKVHETGKTPLLLTYSLMKKENPLQHSWSVTSDSIACWVANRINGKLLILTNVDGIYNGSCSTNNENLIKSINAEKLLIFEETSVDKYLPELLIKYHLDCYVLNGKYPDRVLTHLNNDDNYNYFYTYIGGE